MMFSYKCQLLLAKSLKALIFLPTHKRKKKKKDNDFIKLFVVDTQEKPNFHKAIHKIRLMLTCSLPPKAQWSTWVTYAIYICYNKINSILTTRKKYEGTH